jgi:hypothetical protein
MDPIKASGLAVVLFETRKALRQTDLSILTKLLPYLPEPSKSECLELLRDSGELPSLPPNLRYLDATHGRHR